MANRKSVEGLVAADCANGIHVARLGQPCVCGDPGPTPIPPREMKIGPPIKTSTKKPG